MADRKSLHPLRGQTIAVGEKKSITQIQQTSITRFSIDDIVFTNSSKNNPFFENGVVERHPQKMIIKEFQPSAMYNVVLRGQEMTRLLSKAYSEVSELLKNSAESTFTSTTFSDSQFNDKTLEERYIKIPLDYIMTSIAGSVESIYELPYNDDNFLQIDNISSWTSDKNQSQTLGAITNVLSKYNIQMDGTFVPFWKNENPMDIETKKLELILVNKDLNSLIKNFKFLHHFISGAFWTTEVFRQHPGSLYNIELPGYYEYFFCSLQLTIDNKGVLRKLRPEGFNTFLSRTNMVGTKMSPDTLFPDYYKLDITFKPMVPNSFNVYLNYLLNGSSNINVNIT